MSDLPESQTQNVIETLATGDAGDLTTPKDDKFEMRFDYLGWPLIAHIVPHSSGSVHMQLMGRVGRLPYSMEGQNRRLGPMMLLSSTVKRRPTRFAVTKNGEVVLAGDIRVAAPITPHTLITAVTILLASIKPYLDIFPFFIESERRSQP